MSSAPRTPARTSDSDAPSGDEPGTWTLNLSKPYQYVILALFALYAPSAIGQGQGPFFEPYLQLLLFVSLVFGSLLISTTNLAGPLRYAYHNYRFLIEKAYPLISLATTKVTAWAPLPFLVLALLPWFRSWFFMGVIPLTWQFVRGEHRHAVSDISNRIDECCTRAEAAANKALSDAEAAKQYKHDLEQNLRATNFYNKPSAAWATLDKSQSSAKNVMQIPTAQGVLADRAKLVAATVNSVIADVADAFSVAQKSLRLASEVQNLVARIKTAVEEGRMTDVENLMRDAEDKLKTAEEELAKAATAREDARTHAREVYLDWQVICEKHRHAVRDTGNHIDECCARAEAAANKALSDAAAAKQYMHDLEQNLRATNFYNKLSAAWATLDKSQSSAKNVIHIPTAQGVLATGAKSVAATVNSATANVATATNVAQKLLGLAGEVQNLVAKIKTAAEEGRMIDVENLMDSAEHKLKTAEEELGKVATAKEDARTHARDIYIAWQVVCEEYQKAVCEVTEQVDESCYLAKIAAEHSHQHTRVGSEYEKQALIMMDAARRDYRIAVSARVIDFFDKTTEAWSTLDKVNTPVRNMTEKAKGVLEYAEAIVDENIGTDDDDDENEDDDSERDAFVKSANAAVAACEDVRNQMDVAQATINESRNAHAQAAVAREAVVKNVNDTGDTLLKLAKHTKDMSAGLMVADQGFEKVKWLADQAKTLALQGEMALASTSALSAKSEVEKVVEVERKLCLAEKTAHDLLLTIQLGDRVVSA